jgi:uncharacterized sulfatase
MMVIRMIALFRQTVYKYFTSEARWLKGFLAGRFYLRSNLLYLLGLIGVLLVLNTVLRIIFLVINRGFIGEASFLDLLTALLTGMRFDIATLFLFNFAIIVLFTLPVRLDRLTRRYSLFALLSFMINLPIFFSNIIDIEYYRLSEKRLSYELYSMWREILSFGGRAALDYYPLLLLLAGLGGAYYVGMRVVIRRIEGNSDPRPALSIIDFATSVIALLVLFTGIRGGLQVRPLRPAMAFTTQNSFLGHAAGNSAYNLLDAVWLGKNETVKIIDPAIALNRVQSLIKNEFDSEFIDPEYPLLRRSTFPESQRRMSVVILVLESMNAEYFGSLNPKQKRSLTPELDMLTKESLYFDNYYSNAKRSIEAFPAILNSLPDIFEYPVIGSRLATNTTWGIGNILQKNGYQTLFFHGAKNGSLGLDTYSRIAGFNRYYGMDEFGNTEGKWDRVWGVYDNYFISFMRDILREESGPYLSVFFSLSNHHPYEFPDDGYADIKALKEPVFYKSMRYTDRVVGEFMAFARKDPAFKNTIFIITADHATLNEIHSTNTFDYFRIPLLIYAPGLVRPGINHTQGSHLDLLPTLIDLLKIRTYHASAGVSLLNPERDGMLFRQDYGYFLYADRRYAAISNFMGFTGYFGNRQGRWLPDHPPLNISVSHQVNLSSLYQTMKNAISQNRIMKEKYRVILE